jgi:hypothetical protein
MKISNNNFIPPQKRENNNLSPSFKGSPLLEDVGKKIEKEILALMKDTKPTKVFKKVPAYVAEIEKFKNNSKLYNKMHELLWKINFRKDLIEGSVKDSADFSKYKLANKKWWEKSLEETLEKSKAKYISKEGAQKYLEIAENERKNISRMKPDIKARARESYELIKENKASIKEYEAKLTKLIERQKNPFGVVRNAFSAVKRHVWDNPWARHSKQNDKLAMFTSRQLNNAELRDQNAQKNFLERIEKNNPSMLTPARIAITCIEIGLLGLMGVFANKYIK